jgi:RHH-type transcriptional regulator, proline utilization regulon repressor / proline dehydrogenase / delta 1-pyrroline-5-carboxylate dehydrogenase
MATEQSRSREVALDAAAADSRALRAALGETGAWRARAESLARTLVEATLDSRAPLFDVQRAFAIFPPESPAGESLFRLAEALPRIPDRPSRTAMLADRVPALRGWKAVAALPFAGLAMDAIGRQFVYAETIAGALRRAGRDASAGPATRFSFDMLGEGARTDADADRNFRRYMGAIRAMGQAVGARGAIWRERLEISVKLSSIHPRYDAASYAQVRGELLDRLKQISGRAAAAGIGLTIDAEESERLSLQVDLFEALSADPALDSWGGLGLAVQAYQPRALETVDALLEIAGRRRKRGGMPIAVRLVKGAYWDAEVKRAQELGLERYPVFTDKRLTDLSYLACARRLTGLDSVRPQFATHNPVTLACVLALADRLGGASAAPARFECQRLHGMGRGLYRTLAAMHPDLPVGTYAPVGEKRELFAYLVRRLLENSASASYVRQAARAKRPDDLLRTGFAFLDAGLSPRDLPSPTELHMPQRRIAKGYDLGDSATLAAWAKSVDEARRAWTAGSLVSGVRRPGPARPAVSPARPDVTIGEVSDATLDTARSAIDAAYAARTAWSAVSVPERAAALERLSDLLEADMAGLMALCVWEAGKTLVDAMADVREAVDFCRYYAQQAREGLGRPMELPGPAGERNVLTLHGRGVFACISPWNFPVAIFTGQVAAALVAGNTVVAKPAEQAALTAYRIAELILKAGVPPGVFHLLCGNGGIGRALVADPRVAGIAFTGSTDTARAIQRTLADREGPIVPLIAETGGLNAMIVDSSALPEQVVDAVVASAFRSAGQRCSSLRVLYLQHEIAPAVLDMLRGAMAALRIGDPADPATDVGPVIDGQARGKLAEYISDLRSRAELIAESGPVPPAGTYIAPVAFEIGSIREVPGERFGPILHVARFALEDLDRVVDDISATGYGLTMGVHTRVDSRAERIRARSAVGNLYVNRSMIGAVVGEQPFGGEGLSGTGPKAGGPNYLVRFTTERVFTVNTAAAGGDIGLLTGRMADAGT